MAQGPLCRGAERVMNGHLTLRTAPVEGKESTIANSHNLSGKPLTQLATLLRFVQVRRLI